MRRFSIIGVFVILCLSSDLAAARQVVGDSLTPDVTATIAVVDGDGLRINDLRIRLWGIDAPELKQMCEGKTGEYACGEDARFLLGALAAAGDLRCVVKDVDRYGRTVAQCRAGGVDIGAEMVRQGYALDWQKYSQGHYQEQEAEARAQGRGLWAGDFVAPWDWRQSQRH